MPPGRVEGKTNRVVKIGKESATGTNSKRRAEYVKREMSPSRAFVICIHVRAFPRGLEEGKEEKTNKTEEGKREEGSRRKRWRKRRSTARRGTKPVHTAGLKASFDVGNEGEGKTGKRRTIREMNLKGESWQARDGKQRRAAKSIRQKGAGV